jgi:hypothetical protein
MNPRFNVNISQESGEIAAEILAAFLVHSLSSPLQGLSSLELSYGNQ